MLDLRKVPKKRDTTLVEDTNQLTQITDYEPLRILERRDEWLFVEAPHQPVYTDGKGWHGYRGWVHAKRLEERLPAASLPMQERAYIVEQLRAFLGVPYLWGGLSKAGIDCSGLVHLAYRKAGYRIPRDSGDQRRLCVSLTPGELQPADVIFLSDGKKTTHVMAYCGHDSLIEAIMEIGCVREIGIEERLRAPLHAVEQGRRLPSGKRCYTATLFSHARTAQTPHRLPLHETVHQHCP